DLINIQRCNQLCLPENYLAQFWAFSIVSWPHASFLAENAGGMVVGYVLASVEPVDGQPHLLIGHINSLAVLRPYRRLGLAKRLMNISRESMTSTYHLQYIQLNVRISNRAALALYRDVLGYTIYRVERKYYADSEDAFTMRLWIHGNPNVADTRSVLSFIYLISAMCEDAGALTNPPNLHTLGKKDEQCFAPCISTHRARVDYF
ncbi:silencing group B protein, partial [Pisolithus orientalis]|uniref:silencing group B protein n=1 Tax=Pisolithus orientalis TaxID=936130 RepID=UPI0022247721